MIVPRIIFPPDAELLTIEECRDQLEVQPYEIDSDGVGTHPHDAMIMRMQAQARAYCETFTGLSLAQKTYEIALDAFPSAEIELPMPPIVEIVSVKYVDVDQVQQTLASNLYVLDDRQKPGWLALAVGASWPATASVINAVKVRYVSGYQGTTPTSDGLGDQLLEDLESGLRVRLAFLYANREGTPEKADLQNHLDGMEAILRPWRIRLGMA